MEVWLDLAQLLSIGNCQAFQQVEAGRGEGNIDRPAVGIAVPAVDQAGALHSIDQTDRAVVADLQSLRKLFHRDFVTPRKALYRQHREILLDRDSGLVSALFAPAEEPSKSVSEAREAFVICFGQRTKTAALCFDQEMLAPATLKYGSASTPGPI